MNYYNEIDPYAAQWLRNLIAAGQIPGGFVDELSIEDVRPDELTGFTQCHFFAGIGGWPLALRLAGWPDSRPAWTGSCPCQPFSAAGKGAGFDDERHLWPAWQHLIAVCRPSVIFGEQVASKAVDPWIDLVHADLEGMGYAFGGIAFPAAGIGAPHIRDRTYWVADAGSAGSLSSTHTGVHRGEGISRARHGELERSGTAFGLADADGRDASAEREQRSREQRQQPQDGGAGSPGPVNGQWADADWLGCTDGKWRPVIPSHVEMVDGLSDTMGRVCPEHEAQEKVINHGKASNSDASEVLQALPDSTETKDDQRQDGRSSGIHKPDLLRPRVHGSGDGQRNLHQHEPHADESTSPSETEVRNVREGGKAPRPPQGREPFQQFPVELDDVVSLLSSSLSFAANNGRRRDQDALLALCESICSAGLVRDTPEQAQAVWASLGEEAKNRIRLGFDVRAWRRVVFFPLSSGETSRVGRLKAYGNAIVPAQAAQFITAYVEARGLIAVDLEQAA